jgi:hypothetical protein
MFYYVSLRSKFRGVIFITISAYKRYLVDLYLQFAEGCMEHFLAKFIVDSYNKT